MRTLVVGAGGIGGYFGGRMVEAGRDVTFLVRPRRAEHLAKTGLVIKSQHGDFHTPTPKLVLARDLREPFDLVLLSCKAYDLDDAIESFAPAVGPSTAILPTLNGIRHIDVLAERFGADAVLGGLAFISSTMDDEGRILHLNPHHLLVFGERNGARSARIQEIAAELATANFESRLSEVIVQDMWEKWVFIATGAGITSMMRAGVGDIEAAGGAPLASKLLDECAATAAAAGYAPSDESVTSARTIFTTPGSALKASMLRDIERGGRTECEHLLGDLLRRGPFVDRADSLLRAAYVHVAAYELTRAQAVVQKV